MFFQYNCASFNAVHTCNYSERESERKKERERDLHIDHFNKIKVHSCFKEVLFHVYPFVIRCFNLDLLNLEPLSICKIIALHIKYMSQK